MSFRWRKQGRIFQAGGEFGWINSHTQIPTILVKDDRLRIYFSTRPEPGLSVTAYLDVDRDDPTQVLHIHDRPVLAVGEPGMFDEHGAMPLCALTRGDEVWLYYCGWSRRTTIPYSNWTGLAISRDGGHSFERAYPGPVMDRTPTEPYSATSVTIVEREGLYYAIYSAGVGWPLIKGRYEERYLLKRAWSRDGISWERPSDVLIPPRHEWEAIHRPTVLDRDGRYHMWHCYRGVDDFRDGANAYRIGYAWSEDLESWHREDELAGITVSDQGWDSAMITYPQAVALEDRTYLFYCGNGFGTDGFGYAVLEEAG